MEYLIFGDSIITLVQIRQAKINEPDTYNVLGEKVLWKSEEEREKNHTFCLHYTDERLPTKIFRGTLEQCQSFRRAYISCLNRGQRAVEISEIKKMAEGG